MKRAVFFILWIILVVVAYPQQSWIKNNKKVYLVDPQDKVGVGTSTGLTDKFSIQSTTGETPLMIKGYSTQISPFIKIVNSRSAYLWNLYAVPNWWVIGNSFDSTFAIMSVKPNYVRFNGTVKATRFAGAVNSSDSAVNSQTYLGKYASPTWVTTNFQGKSHAPGGYASQGDVHDSLVSNSQGFAKKSDTGSFLLSRTRATSTYQSKGSYLTNSGFRDSSDLKTLHSTFSSAPLSGVTTQKGVNDALDLYITNYLTAYQGLAWNESTDTYARLGSIAGIATGSSPGNGNLPVQSKMRGCVVNDAGVVQYYLSDWDWNYKADGTASTLTGADGQVMVEIPKFYYKYLHEGSWHSWCISLYPLTGYSVHPAFVVGSTTKNYIYISAYEATLYDVSASIYANGIYLPADTVTFAAADSSITVSRPPWYGLSTLAVGDKIAVSGTTNNNRTYTIKTVGDYIVKCTAPPTNETSNTAIIQTERDFTTTTGDKLSSVSGKVPITYFNRSQARVAAANRGSGWSQISYDDVHLIEILGLIEYGTFYWQNIAELGPGITSVSNWDKYNNYNPFALSGNGNVIGNATGDNAGASVISTEKTKYSKYRGIENFYGHIYKFVDGLNTYNNKAYVNNNSATFTSDDSTNYTFCGTMINSDGWQKTLLNSPRVILPNSVSGSSSTYLTDYYYQSTGWRVACFGGVADHGSKAGGFYWDLSYNSGFAYRSVGARVALK